MTRRQTLLGVVLILLSFPFMALVSSQVSGLAVVLVGVVAYFLLAMGVYSCRRWLGIASRGETQAQGGCLTLLVTFAALLSGIAITYYIVFYGASSRMSGSGR